MSAQSFLRFPLCSPEDLSSSESSTSSPGDDDKILVGKVTNDKIKTPFGAKDIKATVVEDRKMVISARKALAVGRKKEHLISAKANATKAGPKSDKNCTNLAEATKGTTGLTPPGCGASLAVFFSSHSHPHKKCRGIHGSPSSVYPLEVALSCSRSKRWRPQIRGSGDNDKMLIGKDTNNKMESLFASLAKRHDSLSQGTHV